MEILLSISRPRALYLVDLVRDKRRFLQGGAPGGSAGAQLGRNLWWIVSRAEESGWYMYTIEWRVVDTVWCKIWEKQEDCEQYTTYWLAGRTSQPPTPSFHQMMITVTITVIDMIMNECKSDGHPGSSVARTRFAVWAVKGPLSWDPVNVAAWE